MEPRDNEAAAGHEGGADAIETVVPVHAVADPAQLGVQDLVVLSVKTTG
ncbi:MAG: hypothetical protein KJ011_03175 [Burkholderiaceae bacterium]|nr:hypothetical protein [Burkholderiaceae bacterium]